MGGRGDDVSKRSEWLVSKTEVVSDDGVVATMYPQATEAGIEMLRRGGNAIDAAVAAGFAVGVVEPFNSGLGGIAVLVYHERRTGRTYVLDGTGTLPHAIRPDQFALVEGQTATGVYGWAEVEDDANNTGYLTAAVPGMPACLGEAHERFGVLPRAAVLEPAIHYAENGFPIDWYVCLGMAVNQARLHRFPESRRTFFRPDGSCYRAPMLGVEGDWFRQPDLARTLRLIGEQGTDVVYRGEVAELIAQDMEANGGLLGYDDLAGYRVRVSETGIVGEYRGHQVIGGLENTGFPTVLQALNLLEGFDLHTLGAGSVEEIHLIAEAQRLAFADRFRYLGDADRMPVPLEGILSKGYAAERRRALDAARASLDAAGGDLRAGGGGEGLTTHLTVVDRDRNMVSLLSTLGLHFGSAVVAKGTGIALNNGTMWFDPVPGSTNSVGPNLRIMTAGAPAVVLRDGAPLLAVGSPGGRRVISAVLQSIVNVVDHGMGAQEAVTVPRAHCEGRPTIVDARIGEERLEALRRLGHELEVMEETFSTTYFGRPNMVMVDPATGRLLGGVNQYKPAYAMGL
jgi:gamma-glutamyltranspeptidase/glutathione hydrolase